MKQSIEQCIEALEERILVLEQGRVSPEALSDALGRLGLLNVRYPSANVATLMDMLIDGIAPVTPEMVTAFLSMADGQRQLLFSMAGIVEDRAEKIRELRASGEYVEPQEAGGERSDADGAPGKSSATESAPQDAAASATADDEHAEVSAPQQAESGKAKAQPAAPAKGGKGGSEISSIRVSTEKLDTLIDYVGKLMTQYAVIAQNPSLDAKAIAGMKELETVIASIKNEVEKIRLVPLKQIFTPMHRLVSSLTLKMGKKLRFEVVGDDLELDKTIVEHINEPLVHLLRNAVDHGMEMPEDRAMAGKDETGTLTLSAERRGDKAFITVEDDGKGIDPERIRAKAVERGLMTGDEVIAPEEVLRFILKSGFSTAEKVTDVSGRGVGMDAVAHSIEGKLGGEICIRSNVGQGSVFTLAIPLERSLSEGIVDALIVRLAGELFVVPSQSVLEVYAVRRRDIASMPGGEETVDVRGELYSLFRLDRYFGLAASGGVNGSSQAVVIKVGNRRAAFLVDEVLRQQQVVVANFTIPVKDIYRVPILGYGMIGERDALVLDVESLLDYMQA
ncbi:two-component system chemotaxis sensor kinase CheA [Desulfobaculum xiamenense]|uniref:Chemotaxis protein CheA n=1 Tax=Desulfobaculum xiamenense TaxID=995050 RepID=A0A846QMQ1_9BACT|nr:chemotaxis protein CheW [Desulfobaculum xiamenense]NJB66524.1 two-component system chemotaxis sensor kinase CheA [Desulfobaculum xiamenense]